MASHAGRFIQNFWDSSTSKLNRFTTPSSMTRDWLQPISSYADSAMCHLVPAEGWLVKALCGHLVNLRFAKPSNERKCKVCERRVATEAA